jgi:hypothetical protein
MKKNIFVILLIFSRVLQIYQNTPTCYLNNGYIQKHSIIRTSTT